MTYSFPCTDLSVAGKMQGMSKKDWEEGNSTRSGLLWEIERILKECSDEELPDVLLMENVPQVHAEANRADFDSWLNFLKSKGYWNFWKDLNAKDFGIPQNRDRCFCVSILSKDFVDFEFPEPVKLEKVMKDYLEEFVDEKYFINTEKAQKLIRKLIDNGLVKQQENKKEKIYLGNYYGRHDGYDGSVFHPNGLCKTITHSVGGIADVLEERIPANLNYKKIDKINIRVAKTIMARDCKGFNTGFDTQNGVIEFLSSEKVNDNITYVETQYRIRKLTPKECWRLMGYTDKDFEKAAEVNSNTQLYKQAGNAIVKQVLMAIFSQLLN